MLFNRLSQFFTSPWLNLVFSLIYLKECIVIGEEAKLLNLGTVVYIPFMLLLWFCSIYFWTLFLNEKGNSKIFTTVFMIALFFVPICVLIFSKNIYFSLPIFWGILEPLKNKYLHGSFETKDDLQKFFILAGSFVLLFLSGIVSHWFGIEQEEYLFGALYYAFLFYFDFKIISYLKHVMK